MSTAIIMFVGGALAQYLSPAEGWIEFLFVAGVASIVIALLWFLFA